MINVVAYKNKRTRETTLALREMLENMLDGKKSPFSFLYTWKRFLIMYNRMIFFFLIIKRIGIKKCNDLLTIYLHV